MNYHAGERLITKGVPQGSLLAPRPYAAGGGGAVAPPQKFSKHFFFYTQILDFTKFYQLIR